MATIYENFCSDPLRKSWVRHFLHYKFFAPLFQTLNVIGWLPELPRTAAWLGPSRSTACRRLLLNGHKLLTHRNSETFVALKSAPYLLFSLFPGCSLNGEVRWKGAFDRYLLRCALLKSLLSRSWPAPSMTQQVVGWGESMNHYLASNGFGFIVAERPKPLLIYENRAGSNLCISCVSLSCREAAICILWEPVNPVPPGLPRHRHLIYLPFYIHSCNSPGDSTLT